MDIRRAKAVLATRPEIDAAHIGITGISWGGYLTCLVAGTLAAVGVLSMQSRASVAAPTREALASGFDA